MPASEAGGNHGPTEPSQWVLRFADLVPAGGTVLDVACGGGRHSRLFAARGHPVAAVDRDVSGLADLGAEAGVEIVEADLEDGSPWAFDGRAFAGIVVTNYLWRPLLPILVASLAPGGVLIYETFARGNERFGRPANPDHLLRRGELLEAVRGRLLVIAYEDGLLARRRRQAAVQRLCAVNAAGEGGTEPLHPLYPAPYRA